MKVAPARFNLAVAAILALPAPAWADAARLDELFAMLRAADPAGAGPITQEIWREWSQSGSPAMDLLLARGEAALARGDFRTAIGHFTAIIDQAPDFAEAWNGRATAYFYLGDLGPSIGDIQHVLALNPRHFGALAGLGMIFEELDEPEKALEAYRAALAVNPHLRDVKEAIARLEAAKGQEL